MNRATGVVVIIVFLLGFRAESVAGQETRFPLIDSANSDDLVFQQHQTLVAEYHRASATGGTIPPLTLFAYEPGDDDSLFTIAARVMIPYDAIATLNGMDRAAPTPEVLTIPSSPGLFVPLDPLSDLERVLSTRLSESDRTATVTVGERAYRFFADARFTPTERTLFLDAAFRDPLPEGRMTSRFGYRIHPISRIRSFHQGIDLAAPFGAPVSASASGTVIAVGRDPWLGLWIEIDHGNGFSTRYAHLRLATVALNDTVASGMIVGEVGSTGLSTGPHLHFELRFRGEPRDPEQYLSNRNR